MLPRNHPDHIRVAFDDRRLVANAGLLLPATLAHHLGLSQLVQERLGLGDAPGRANTGDKVMTLVASALAGGDCIDDADVLRTGGTACTLGGTVKAPSTLGTFLRSFRWGHVRQRRRRQDVGLGPHGGIEGRRRLPQQPQPQGRPRLGERRGLSRLRPAPRREHPDGVLHHRVRRHHPHRRDARGGVGARVGALRHLQARGPLLRHCAPTDAASSLGECAPCSARMAARPGAADRPSSARCWMKPQNPVPFREILAWKFSRFAGKRDHAVAFKSMLRRRGIRVTSITEHAADSPTGKLMEAIIESVDEFYSENLAH